MFTLAALRAIPFLPNEKMSPKPIHLHTHTHPYDSFMSRAIIPVSARWVCITSRFRAMECNKIQRRRAAAIRRHFGGAIKRRVILFVSSASLANEVRRGCEAVVLAWHFRDRRARASGIYGVFRWYCCQACSMIDVSRGMAEGWCGGWGIAKAIETQKFTLRQYGNAVSYTNLDFSRSLDSNQK